MDSAGEMIQPLNQTNASSQAGAMRLRYRPKFTLSEGAFRKILYLAGISVLVLLIAIFLSLLLASLPSIKALGFRFLTGSTWNPVTSQFGALPFLVGTLVTSFFALLISTFFSLPISIFLGYYYQGGKAASFVKTVIELLAGIPSVIYGFWGLFFFIPIIRWIETETGCRSLRCRHSCVVSDPGHHDHTLFRLPGERGDKPCPH